MMNNFEDIIGNTSVIEFLKGSIRHSKVSHAYIIDGIEGIGKKMLANAFAKTLQCEAMCDEPCNHCVSCKTFDSKNNPDIIYVRPSKTIMTVDDIRDKVNKSVGIKPYKGPYKIYIIENADKMNVQAQNALLKTIEEPPSYIVMLLVSNNSNNFLKTILSRSILLKLKPLTSKQVCEYLEDEGVENCGLSSLYSMGSIGRALKIATDQNFIDLYESVIKIAVSIKEKDLVGLFGLYKEFEPKKENIQEVLDILYIWYRDLLIIKETYKDKVLQKDNLELLENEKENYTHEGLINILEQIEKTKVNLMQNANFQLSIEILMVKIKENTRRR